MADERPICTGLAAVVNDATHNRVSPISSPLSGGTEVGEHTCTCVRNFESMEAKAPWCDLVDAGCPSIGSILEIARCVGLGDIWDIAKGSIV
eukprot:scaffold2510_cov169-Amphora_coffeaeformis.AAC.56